MEALRERCTSPPPRLRYDDQLPLTHAGHKARRQHSGGRAAARGSRASRGRAWHLTVRLLLALLAVAVTVRVAHHLFGSPEPQLEDLMRLYGDALAPGGGSGAANASGGSSSSKSSSATAVADAVQQPKLIPRIIHQIHAGSSAAPVPTALLPYLASWRRLNPGWEVQLYDEQDCLEFVRSELPEYLDAYRRLGKPVERANFFSYMVVLRHGGVYADLDAECRRPLDGVIASRDTLVAGWDTEWADPRSALEAGYVRQRQLVQSVFAGAPGHPALRELCDRIAAGVGKHHSFSTDSRLDALERSGAGLFTDVLLAHAAAHPPAQRQDPWGVRLLPRVTFGAPVKPAHGLSPADPGVAVLHHPQDGAWGRRGSSSSWPQLVQDVTSEVARRWRHEKPADAWEMELKVMQQRDAAQQLYPVSVDFEPPFDLLTHRLGQGERQSGADVGAALSTHGSWQPSVQPSRRPSLVEAVVGSMGGAGGKRNVLVDVGAGYGLLSLAAAARGHRVHAFELGPASLEALEASIQHNGFEHLVQVHKEALGSPQQEGYTCILPRQGAASGTSTSSGSSSGSRGSGSVPAGADVEVQRGYGPAAVHAMPAESCQLMTRRSAGAWAIPETDRVAALRVSANGWEGFVLQGFAPLLERADRPPVLAVEWNPAAMKAAGWRRPLKLLEWLYGLGYTDVSHSGYVCDSRWYSITYGIRRRGGITPEDLASLRQPTWCRLLPQHFSLLLDQAAQAAYPETLLLVSREVEAGNATTQGGSSSSSSSSSGASSDSSSNGSSAGGTDEYGVPDAVSQALAEAALMVADASAHQTAAAVSDLTAAAGNGSRDSPAALAAQSLRQGGEAQRPRQSGQRSQQRSQQQQPQQQQAQTQQQPQQQPHHHESAAKQSPG